jgi:hypothetical protein
VFPVRIKVPHSQLSGFLISPLCFGNPSNMQGSLMCFSLQPFSVVWHRFLTPQSVVIQFAIRCTLPDGWTTPIAVAGSSLKFSESAPGEPELASSIAIIPMGSAECALRNGDVLSVAFSLRPISDLGAIRIARLPLSFAISWAAEKNDYVSMFAVSLFEEDADLIISTPMTRCELMKQSVLPLRITNMCDRSRTIKLCFGSGAVQPMMKDRELIFEPGDEGKVVEFGFVPLAVGEHNLNIWGEEKGRKIFPMFPICLSVQKPSTE